MGHFQERLFGDGGKDVEDITARFHGWQYGRFPAVHCQTDDHLTIAGQIRSGRFIHHLFSVMYSSISYPWTRRGINVGAGMELEGDDDPLLLWTQTLATKVILMADER